MPHQILDRSRDYGTITPPLEGKAFYEQDGRWFGNDFRRVYLAGEKPEPEEKLDAAAKNAKQKANKAKQAALNPNDPAAAIYDKPPWRRNTHKAVFTPKDAGRGRKYPRKVIGKAPPKALPKAAATVADPQVNLSAWAIGEEKLLFGTVKSEIRKRFNIVVGNEQSALAVLVREKIVSAADIPGYGEGEPDQAAA